MALVDTNVLVVANARLGEHQACVDACVDCIAKFTSGVYKLHLDSLDHILTEYGRHIQHATPKGVGDLFFIWASTYKATPTYCIQVDISPDPGRGYIEFPSDPSLVNFDRSDRKFVAVAIASGQNPTIFNATDSDWHQFAGPLSNHVCVVELC